MKKLPKPRYAAVRSLFDQQGQVLDSEALVLYIPAPKTVTGEDVLELHIHGGPAIVKAVLAAIGKCSTTNRVRYAEPGEFTRRAFLNDRMDLTKVEALGDTLSAVTEEQRRLSVQGTVSGLAARYESWRQSLLAARGELEALIDFSEDQHFDESPAELVSSVAVQVRALNDLIVYHSSNAVRGELLRNGITLSLIGAPNVGKSSLLNQIVGRNAAIVSHEAGTTRDVVEVGIDLGGFFCRLGDTAGLRSSSRKGQHNGTVIGDVEKEGMRRARENAEQSDVVILVICVEAGSAEYDPRLFIDDEVLQTARDLLVTGKNLIVAVNKMDNNPQQDATRNVVTQVQTLLPQVAQSRIFCISCKDATARSTSSSASVSASADPGNLQRFATGLIDLFKDITNPLSPAHDTSSASMWQESLGATERQRVLLDECSFHLTNFLDQVDTAAAIGDGLEKSTESGLDEADFDIVVAAESLRAAADCLAKLTGRGHVGDVEEVLGVVFEKYVDHNDGFSY